MPRNLVGSNDGGVPRKMEGTIITILILYLGIGITSLIIIALYILYILCTAVFQINVYYLILLKLREN
jgi:hypothetical protein